MIGGSGHGTSAHAALAPVRWIEKAGLWGRQKKVEKLRETERERERKEKKRSKEEKK